MTNTALRDDRDGVAAESIRTSTGADRVKTFVADLSSIAEARGLAAAYAGSTDRLDVSFNNAGIGGSEDESEENVIESVTLTFDFFDLKNRAFAQDFF